MPDLQQRTERARAYANSARQRIDQRECKCIRCIEAAEQERLEAVLRVLAARSARSACN